MPAFDESQHPRDDSGRFTVSAAAPEDHAAVKALVTRSMTNYPGMADQFERDVRHGGAGYVVRHRGTPIAYGMTDRSFAADDVWEAGWVVTDPEYRGKGLASHVLAALEDHAAEKGANAMMLATATPDFYRKRGYRTIHADTGLLAKPLTVEKTAALGNLAKRYF